MTPTINRRTFLGSTIFIPGIVPRLMAQDARGAGMSEPVQTTAGRVRGLVRYGVNQFYGVPYAGSTAGANRFMPPVKPASWTGVRDCFQVGERAPQDEEGPISEVFSLDRREPMGEDCLKINVYTPGLGNGRRPVMVWLHGGGFSGGSGNWLLYDGTNLARKEDVVVVGVNHRLNLFGFLYLADLGGEKWANSSNVGMQDIVAALGWIKENISAFGGDPGNVTIFGQSGGGGKVSTLMAMPAAKGLFHRAVVQSGALLRLVSFEESARFGYAFLAELNLSKAGIDKIQTMPLDALYAASRSAAAKLGGDGRAAGGRGPAFGFRPVVDGKGI